MCIIAIPKLPMDWEIWEKYLRNMSKHNPDGNGIIYENNNGSIFWAKGVDINWIRWRIESLSKSINRIYIHCRAASHGVVSKRMTHPFLVSPDRDMYLQEGQLHENEALIMQNGVFSTLPENKSKSDTAIMCETIRRYTPVIESAESLINLLMPISPASKLIVASTKDGIWRTTNFIKDEHGFFSNTTHIKPKQRLTRVVFDLASSKLSN